jgi:hypothetical protein
MEYRKCTEYIPLYAHNQPFIARYYQTQKPLTKRLEGQYIRGLQGILILNNGAKGEHQTVIFNALLKRYVQNNIQIILSLCSVQQFRKTEF